MNKKIAVKCECEGTGFIAVADSGGDGVQHVECGQHHRADAPSVDELFAYIGKQTGISTSSLSTTRMKCDKCDDRGMIADPTIKGAAHSCECGWQRAYENV
jgi:hypothetical protein